VLIYAKVKTPTFSNRYGDVIGDALDWIIPHVGSGHWWWKIWLLARKEGALAVGLTSTGSSCASCTLPDHQNSRLSNFEPYPT